MKQIFRKALTVASSAALVGMSAGFAAAASYPEPFKTNSAVVVGSGAAAADSTAAGNIISNLDSSAAGSTGGSSDDLTGGEVYKIEKSTTLFHLGLGMGDVVSTTLDDDEFPNLLADGEFTDDDNDDFDYTQKLTLANKTLEFFADSNYMDKEPTIGLQYANGEHVLNYTLDFTDRPLLADMATSDVTIMGKEYYILAVDATSQGTKVTLLDAASDTILAEEESVTLTVDGTTYEVEIAFISDTEVKLTINGETTNALAEAETYKLDDGSYVGVKDILYTSKDTGISKVEFSIGNGRLILEDNQEVELNEDTISDLNVFIVNTTTEMDTITIEWDAEDESFVTTEESFTMPGFGNIKVGFGGMDFPKEETIEILNDGDDGVTLSKFPLQDSTEDIPLLYAFPDANRFAGTGQDDTSKLVTAPSGANITFDSDTDEYFIVTYFDGNDDGESYLARATDFTIESSVNKTTLQYRKDGSWVDAKKDAEHGDEVDFGDATVTIYRPSNDGNNVTIAPGSNTNFHTLYSKEGMKVWLPVINNTNATGVGVINISANASTWVLSFEEEDKDDNLGDGNAINVTLGFNSDNETSVTTTAFVGSVGTEKEIGDTNEFRNYVYSALATEVLHDRDPDQRTLSLIYHGMEVGADVYIASSAATSSGGSDSGVMSVTDDEVATVAGKDLIVVGGSAINSVAAELLGGAFSEGDFTAETGVGPGEFLIESFDRSGNTALLVAGYNAADTTKAATYLLNNDVTTDVGTKYKGTSATEATLVV